MGRGLREEIYRRASRLTPTARLGGHLLTTQRGMTMARVTKTKAWCGCEVYVRSDGISGIKHDRLVRDAENRRCKKCDDALRQAQSPAGQEIARSDSEFSTTADTGDILSQIQKSVSNAKGRRVTCCHCGRTGYAGSYPFSTMPASACTCDDCCDE